MTAGAASASTHRYHPDYENQLFFGRMRRKTKWVFAVLAVVFAMSFVFLGVGSGGGALSDLWNGRFGNFFGGSSGPTFASLDKKIVKDPLNASLRLQLAQLAASKLADSKATPDMVIDAYKFYLRLRPKNTTGLQGLANAYSSKVQELDNQIQSPGVPPLVGLGGFQLVPGTTALGQALTALSSPLLNVTSLQQGETAQLQKQLGKVIQAHLGVYRRIWALTPSDSNAFLQIAQTATQDKDNAAAIAIYKEFLKKFPGDPLVPDVKRQIKQLQAGATSGQSGTPGQTG